MYHRSKKIIVYSPKRRLMGHNKAFVQSSYGTQPVFIQFNPIGPFRTQPKSTF